MNHKQPTLEQRSPDQHRPVTPAAFQFHTSEHPFCYLPSCPCHSDLDKLTEAYFFVFDGLLTEQEAADFVAGKMV
jgi:hypothetical protein